MLIKIRHCAVVGPTSLALVFSNGAEGTYDFAGDLRGHGQLAAELLDPAEFAQVFLELGALCWPNGYDMCGEWVYLQMRAAGALKAPAAAE